MTMITPDLIGMVVPHLGPRSLADYLPAHGTINLPTILTMAILDGLNDNHPTVEANTMATARLDQRFQVHTNRTSVGNGTGVLGSWTWHDRVGGN